MSIFAGFILAGAVLAVFALGILATAALIWSDTDPREARRQREGGGASANDPHPIESLHSSPRSDNVEQEAWTKTAGGSPEKIKDQRA